MRVSRLALFAALGSLLAAPAARAQGPASALAPPGDHVRATRPAGPEPSDATSMSDLEIPAPPGASHEIPGVRYPLPSASELAVSADDEPTIRIPSRITTRLRALDADLRVLAQRGGGNVVNAVLSMLTGGLAITLGALRDTPTDWMSVYLYVYGGSAALRGILDLVLTPNASGAAITYQHMPMTTDREVQARLRYGETELHSLAERALIARILDASINMAVGVAVVPLYLAPNNFEVVSPLDYFILIGAGVSIISGVITLASNSVEEQRWDAYAQLRRRLDAEHLEDGGTPDEDEPVALEPQSRSSLALSPIEDGALGGFALAF